MFDASIQCISIRVLNFLTHRQQRSDYHHELVEHLADADEVMGEIFLDERKPTEEDVHAAIRRATLKRAFTPVMMGTALKNKASERDVRKEADLATHFVPCPFQGGFYEKEVHQQLCG